MKTLILPFLLVAAAFTAQADSCGAGACDKAEKAAACDKADKACDKSEKKCDKAEKQCDKAEKAAAAPKACCPGEKAA